MPKPPAVKIGDKITITANKHELLDIGHHDGNDILWMLGPTPKIVAKVEGVKVWVDDEKWVYTSMIRRFKD